MSSERLVIRPILSRQHPMASMLHINHKVVAERTQCSNSDIKDVMSGTYERVKYYTDY